MNLLTFLSLITDGTSVALWDDYNEQKSRIIVSETRFQFQKPVDTKYRFYGR